MAINWVFPGRCFEKSLLAVMKTSIRKFGRIRFSHRPGSPGRIAALATAGHWLTLR